MEHRVVIIHGRIAEDLGNHNGRSMRVLVENPSKKRWLVTATAALGKLPRVNTVLTLVGSCLYDGIEQRAFLALGYVVEEEPAALAAGMD